jgi:hypothetical protein
MDRFHTLALGRNKVVLDTEVGHLRRLELGAGARSIAPLHTAPWVNDDPIDPDSSTAPTEQALSGDFLCAPFCASDVNGGPIHGWTANSPWGLAGEQGSADAAEARFILATYRARRSPRRCAFAPASRSSTSNMPSLAGRARCPSGIMR